MNKITIHLLTAATAVLFSASSLHGVLFSDTFDYPETDNINTGTNASDNGWWASSYPDNVRIGSDNSPWTGDDGTNIVQIYRISGTNGDLYNTFGGTDDATGSIGNIFTAANQPANLGFIWDFHNHFWGGATNRPEVWIGSGDTASSASDMAIRIGLNLVDMEFLIRGWEGEAPAYAHNTWYRFEVLNVNIADQSYDLNIYSEADLATPFFSETGLKFYNTVTSLDAARFRFISGTANSRSFWIDNFTIIPEPSTYALIFGVLALAGALLRRRLRR